MTTDVKIHKMIRMPMTEANRNFAPKPASVDSQRLAWEFANNVANERINQVQAIVVNVKSGELLPVDALFEIRNIVENK